MFEIRIHGRAGQGAKTIAQLFAEVNLAVGKFVQAFPSYGPAREGAAMNAFVRIDDQPIKLHSDIKKPDAVLVIDPLLVETENVTQGLKKNGIIIINSNASSDSFKKKLGNNFRIYTVPASHIALKFFKKDIPNTVLLGALVKATKIICLDELLKGTKEKFAKKLSPQLVEANLKSIQEGYNFLKIS
ncbi:MAG: 2-oxoacid:acceptor oxidoreductase family protein [Patescibacteria group bacterium]